MIARIRGTVSEVRGTSVYLDVDDLTYEVFVPAVSRPELEARVGQRVTLFTLEYIEGNPGFGNLAPRLVGFLSELERDFFLRFITVPGIGISKGLKAMTLPAGEIAAAVESRDIGTLSRMPGIGRRTAEKVIAELNGKLQGFFTGEVEAIRRVPATGGFQVEAIDALVQLGYRRNEAEELVGRVLAGGSKADTAEKLIQDCFRHSVR
jgi:Holliday junction DNA helicase RuvA